MNAVTPMFYKVCFDWLIVVTREYINTDIFIDFTSFSIQLDFGTVPTVLHVLLFIYLLVIFVITLLPNDIFCN